MDSFIITEECVSVFIHTLSVRVTPSSSELCLRRAELAQESEQAPQLCPETAIFAELCPISIGEQGMYASGHAL